MADTISISSLPENLQSIAYSIDCPGNNQIDTNQMNSIYTKNQKEYFKRNNCAQERKIQLQCNATINDGILGGWELEAFIEQTGYIPKTEMSFLEKVWNFITTPGYKHLAKK